MSINTIKVLVVDDTVTYRKIVRDVLAEVAGIEVVGTAVNGKIALEKIEQLHPDIITLDLEMPVMDGLDVLRHLRAIKSQVGAIMLSAFTDKGAEGTVAALDLGAFDFVLKPTGESVEQSMAMLKRELCSKIEAFAISKGRSVALLSGPAKVSKPASESRPVSSTRDIVSRMSRIVAAGKRPEVVAIGISTGGPQSLTKMLPKLPANLSVPVLIVQHMPPMFTKSLAEDLSKKCALSVNEAYNGQIVEPGHIIIAPGGKQMKVMKSNGAVVVCITDDPPENSCKPAVDYLFRSVANTYGAGSLGVIMTGMGSDGTLGCRLLKRCGAHVLAQDKASCVVYGMPRLPIEEGLADVVTPLDNIAEEITKLVAQGVAV